jgi:adenine-specific DNA-methyltransferase
MNKVFIGGSRQVSRLPNAVEARLDRLMAKDLPVVIGDAAGADKAAQRHLERNAYRPVEVFCSGATPRNNVGAWPIRRIAAPPRLTGRAFHEVKDRAMAAEAAYGLMIWDGRSMGTAMNITRLLRAGRKVAMFLTSERAFHDLDTEDQWMSIVNFLGAGLRIEISRSIANEPAPLPASSREISAVIA